MWSGPSLRAGADIEITAVLSSVTCWCRELSAVSLNELCVFVKGTAWVSH